MAKRKDQAIYDYVASQIATDEPAYWERSVERVATATGLDSYAVRVIVHESSRLRMRTTGYVGWHIVELIHAEPEHVPDQTP